MTLERESAKSTDSIENKIKEISFSITLPVGTPLYPGPSLDDLSEDRIIRLKEKTSYKASAFLVGQGWLRVRPADGSSLYTVYYVPVQAVMSFYLEGVKGIVERMIGGVNEKLERQTRVSTKTTLEDYCPLLIMYADLKSLYEPEGKAFQPETKGKMKELMAQIESVVDEPVE